MVHLVAAVMSVNSDLRDTKNDKKKLYDLFMNVKYLACYFLCVFFSMLIRIMRKHLKNVVIQSSKIEVSLSLEEKYAINRLETPTLRCTP